MSFISKEGLLPSRTVRERYRETEEISNYQYYCIPGDGVADFIQRINNPGCVGEPEIRSIEASISAKPLYAQVVETTELRPGNWFWKREINFKNAPFKTANDLPEAEMVVSISVYPPRERKGLFNKILKPQQSVLATIRVSANANNMFGQAEIDTTFLYGSEELSENITNAFEKLTGIGRFESAITVAERVISRVERAHKWSSG